MLRKYFIVKKNKMSLNFVSDSTVASNKNNNENIDSIFITENCPVKPYDNYGLNYMYDSPISNPVSEVSVVSSSGLIDSEQCDNKTYIKLETKSVTKSIEPFVDLEQQQKLSSAGIVPTLISSENLENASHFVKYKTDNGKIIKYFICGVCCKEFHQQYTLMRHLPIHTNVRNYICRECGKAFRQLSTLTQHQAIHSQERPFNCETCQKSFNRISTLISHRKTHSEDKPYQCNICLKGFHQKGNLRNHVYIHTNARPYICEFCKKGFNQMSNLVCHKQKTHADFILKQWKCARCTMSFAKRTQLRTHELERHQITKTTKKAIGAKNRRATLNTPANQVVVIDQGILIPSVETDAMKTAKRNKQIPYGVLHLIEGEPILVRIIEQGEHHLLRRASHCDFEVILQNPAARMPACIVAAFYQTLNENGEPKFDVLPPQRTYKCQMNQQMLIFGEKEITVAQASSMIMKPSIRLDNDNNNGETKTIAIIEVNNNLVNSTTLKDMTEADENSETYRNITNTTPEIRKDVLLSSNNYKDNQPTLDKGEFDVLLNTIKSEGFDPDLHQIKYFFSENGIYLPDEFKAV